MAGERQVAPWISGSGNSFGFHVGDMNYFGESYACIDSSSVYQREYTPYSYMPLNKEGEHVLNFLIRNPWVWQKEDFCNFTPMGKLGQDKVSIIPCKGKVNIKICTEDFLKTCFKLLYTWRENGQREMDAELAEMLRVVYYEYSAAINEGARIVGLLGGLIEQDQIDKLFESKDESLLKPFKSTLGVCNGVFAEARIVAKEKGKSNLNDKTIFGGEVEVGDNCLLTEEYILKVWDRMMLSARKRKGKLRTLANKKKLKAMRRGDRMINLVAMAHVSPLFWESVAQVMTTRCATLLNPQCRITKVEIGEGQEKETGYKIDDVILIPTDEVSELEECLSGRFLFIYFTFSGNFQLGGSFYNNSGRRELGVRITDEGENSGEKEGQITIISRALFSGTILNKNIIVGAQTIVPDEALLN